MVGRYFMKTRESQVRNVGAASPVKRLTEWLAGRTMAEKVAAVVALRLQSADLQSELQRVGVYDGEIGDDLIGAWEREVENAHNLDDDQRYALEMAAMLEDLTR
jgi:hypothetical protein